ncbi:CLUMA_CG012286, isoform A [Clunio marinus]|uniref:CLUMA_CG012286, isoform A n=1 Tax=Clunio marinus TaxID=568069 RepID=A0A1J1IET1_9DIPT|nr:CLUMA_CG012286, isoform A [Clunio marinus]
MANETPTKKKNRKYREQKKTTVLMIRLRDGNCGNFLLVLVLALLFSAEICCLDHESNWSRLKGKEIKFHYSPSVTVVKYKNCDNMAH